MIVLSLHIIDIIKEMLNEIVSMGIFNMHELFPNNSYIIFKTVEGVASYEDAGVYERVYKTSSVNEFLDNAYAERESHLDVFILGASIAMLAFSIFPTAQDEAFIINYGLKILGAIAVIVGLTAYYYSVHYYNLIINDIVAHYAKRNLSAANLLKLKEVLATASYGAMFEADADYENRLQWYFESIAPFDPVTTRILMQSPSSIMEPRVYKLIVNELEKVHCNWVPEVIKLQKIQEEKNKLQAANMEMEEVTKPIKVKLQQATENAYEKFKKDVHTKQKNYNNSKKNKSSWAWNTTI